MKRFILFFTLVTSLAGVHNTSQAQDSALTLTDRQPQSQTEKDGWHPSLNLGANISFGSSSNVIGQPDGDSKTFGANLDGALNYKELQHEIQNTLVIKGATTKTPVLPRFVKSNDDVKFTSLYLYSLENYSWIGPYVRFNAKTALFYGEDVRSETVTYQKQTRAGVVQKTYEGDSTRLTDGLKPLTTKESIGFFAKFIDEETTKFITRLGFGALQVDASGQYIVKDDKSTANVEIEELKSYTQSGIEGGFSFENTIDKKTSYKFTFDFLTPINPDLEAGDNRDDIELTNLEFNFKLTSKVYEWMAFNYDYNIKKEPQLLDKNQETHLLSMSFAYTLF